MRTPDFSVLRIPGTLLYSNLRFLRTKFHQHTAYGISAGPDTGIHSSHHETAYSDLTDEGPVEKALSEGKNIMLNHSKMSSKDRGRKNGR